jgi:nucleotide-binding universal stress UspA family protein
MQEALMFDRIVVPLDGSPLSECALPYARYMAAHCKAPVLLLSCLGGVPDSLHGLIGDYLQRTGGLLRAAGVEVTGLAHPDLAAEGIVDEGDRQPGTLLVMSTHGRTGTRRWALGSVTDRVVRASRSAMLVVHPEAAAPPAEVHLQTLIVPLDGSALAEQALAPALALARTIGLRLHLLRVAAAEDALHLRTPSFAGAWREMAEESVAASEEYLQAAAARLRGEGAAAECTLLYGSAAECIVDFAENTADGMVVMTSHGRSGIGRWLLGSVAERVIRYSPRPVLLLRARPAGA